MSEANKRASANTENTPALEITLVPEIQAEIFSLIFWYVECDAEAIN